MPSNGMEIVPDLNASMPDLIVREENCVTNMQETEAPTQDVFNKFTVPISGDGAIVSADTENLLLEKQRHQVEVLTENLLLEKQMHQVEVPAQDACIGFTVPDSRDVDHANGVADVAGAIVPADTENLLPEKQRNQVEVPAQDACIGFTVPVSRDVDDASRVADIAGDIVPADTEKLLFEKHKDLWEVAESFEACRNIPQDPHFLPLKSCRKIQREGQALGRMVTFDNIAKKASNWNLDTKREAIEDDLSILEELETHGFHVEKLKNRLNSLLFLKNHHEKINNMSVERKRRLTEHDQNKRENKERLDTIEERMKELQREAELAAKIDKDMDAKIAAEELAEKEGDKKLDGIKRKFERVVASRLY